MMNESQKVVLITGMQEQPVCDWIDKLTLTIGANQGVGFECVKSLIISPFNYHVIIGSRSIPNGEAALSSLLTLPNVKGTASTIALDVTSESSVSAAVSQISAKYGRLDILVNNAGITETPLTAPAHIRLRNVLETNTIGSVFVTESFLPLLRRAPSPRLIFVSSSVGSLSQAADPASPYYQSKTGMKFPHYRASKAALNMLIVEYHKSLKEEGISVLGADPGLVATNFLDKRMVEEMGVPGADVGGETIAEVVRGERDGDGMGRVLGRYGVSPW
ncbi:MAG: hypothetical protein L6R41_003813 [Letrouitia leprolyta]|nr:MAG: hypothetical protein L6R41_003813 [Letrouitia leprolyta]